MSEAGKQPEQTVWRIVGWPDWRWPRRATVELTVASTAPDVVAGIEAAAATKGIVLERKERETRPAGEHAAQPAESVSPAGSAARGNVLAR